MTQAPLTKTTSTATLAAIGLAVAGVLSVLAGTGLLVAGIAGRNSTPLLPSFNIGGPPKPGFKGGRPVGLYFMSRYWIATGSLEKKVWYFAPDGTAYEGLSTGFSDEDLAKHEGRKGTLSVSGDEMTIAWSDGKSTTSEVERDKDGDGFAWDTGLFAPVEAFEDAKAVAGKWEGGESVSFSGSYAAVGKTLEIREDGTYSFSAASSFSGSSDQSSYSVGGQSENAGKWTLDGYSLILTKNDGTVTRGITFPFDDEKTPVYPDRFFFAGTMYKRL
jgi:hypothetical protein